ncbi:MAG: GGDEF domain-containing protein [Ruminococcus sp.]|nr:GGDEF domain-containing protein [Ruminococcus sp.]
MRKNDKRRTIAVCLTGYDTYNEIVMLEGIRQKCAELDINLLTFFNSVFKPALNADYTLHPNTIAGETMVYELINYDTIDGLLIFGGTFLDDDTFRKILTRCREHGLPVLDIDDLSHKDCRRVLLTDGNAMEEMVDHVIEKHGCRDICFMNGFKDNPQSDSRLEAYRASLERHGIPFDEKNIYYGCFWTPAIEETKRLIAERGRDNMPDAIVCANDTMALHTMDVLKESGFDIPKDIIVTGFDAIPDSAESIPSLTTIRRGLREAGEAAVTELTEMMTGGGGNGDVMISAVVEPRQSCGCVAAAVHEEETYAKHISVSTYTREFNLYLLHMHHNFSGTERSEDMFRQLKHGAELCNIPVLYACISAEIEHKQAGYNADEEPKGITYVPEKMVSMFMYGHDVPVGTEFPTADIIPGGVGTREEPDYFMIAPLYFKNSFLGYMALRPSGIFPDGDMFSNWLMTTCNNVGSYYMNNELQEALAELQSLYLHDPLTGIYNRRGMNKLESGFVRSSLDEGKHVAIVCADVDGLKKINDSFGHEEGDNAIVQCTHALRSSFPADSICVRTGGDEFTVLAAFDTTDDVKRAIADVRRHTDAYNEISGKPYNIGCSCGFSMLRPDLSSDMNLEAAKKKADMAMYDEKLRRKSVRTN